MVSLMTVGYIGWMNVMWFDEITFNVFSHNDHYYILRKKGKLVNLTTLCGNMNVAAENISQEVKT